MKYYSTQRPVSQGTSAAAKGLNKSTDAQNADGSYFCRIYDRDNHIDVLSSRYMNDLSRREF